MDSETEQSLLKLELGSIGDLPAIFACLKQQFPPDEFYNYERMTQMLRHNQYKILLYKLGDDLVGYATVCCMVECQTLWLDLLAILPQYQCSGYGGRLFEAIYQKYCGPFNGVLLCTERVDSKDPEYSLQQARRLKFYENHGAYRLNTDFLLPTETGGLPMYLYYKPHKGIFYISRRDQMEIITHMFDYCYSHIKHSHQLLQEFKHTIEDQTFQEGRKVHDKGAQLC